MEFPVASSSTVDPESKQEEPSSPELPYSTAKRKTPTKDKHGDAHLSHIHVGQVFDNKKECVKARVHLNARSGICGNSEGATSIVISGFYDDNDHGETIRYMGTGGGTGRTRNKSQSLDHPQNKQLVASKETGHPVRVLRSAMARKRSSPTTNPWIPSKGIRYDGLYAVLDVTIEPHHEAIYDVCIAKLERLPGQLPLLPTN